ncbi:MAG: TonB-dependent receptor [Leptolyngbya sp. SIOISBB]|nr:TonB-dependent receptor [Leptolyngbya sp. SIOISBB]
MEPALAEPLTPLPEGDPAAIDATSAAALLTEPHVEAELPSLEKTPNSAIASTVADSPTGVAAVVPYAAVVSVMDSPHVVPLANPDTAPAIAQASPVAITDVQIAETANGFSLQLEASGELATPATSITGNAAIADIPNAVLQLPDSEEFFASNPAEGIALLNIINLPNNQVRVAITGTAVPSTVNIDVGTAGLTVSATPGDPTVQAPDEEAIQVLVTGATEDDDYFVPNASTATRTDTPLRDIPNSIQVIPRQVIEDQQAIGLEDVIENAAGVTFLGNRTGRGLEIGIRGFNDAPILLDGFSASIFGFGGNYAEPEVANLERVEILRGPASVLYGQADPGGVVNLVTKKPLSEPYYNFQLQGGSREFISPSIDLSGPLTEDGQLLYRLNALYRQEDSFRDFDNNFERFFIAPSLTWLISGSTDLTVNLEYTEDNEPLVLGLPAIGDSVADIPFERVLTNPDDTVEQDYFNVGYTLEHRFSEAWKLRNRFSYSSSNIDYFAAIPLRLDESTGFLVRAFNRQIQEEQNYALYTNLQGTFGDRACAAYAAGWSRFISRR